MAADLATLRARLRTFALSLPGAYEEFPWGERVAKVAKKVFVFLGKDGDASEAGLSVKLPASRDMALSLPFATPTEYGLGKSGWVTARFTAPSRRRRSSPSSLEERRCHRKRERRGRRPPRHERLSRRHAQRRRARRRRA
jgi:predicted DNA-binding protein (MmcQ/YjbR family)